MQTCIENTALPPVNPPPCRSLESAPAWTIRVARPADHGSQ